MKGVYLYPYGPSKGCHELAKELGILRIKRIDTKVRPKKVRCVINWGASSLPEQVQGCRVINPTQAVNSAIDKKRAFDTLAGYVNLPKVGGRKDLATWFAQGDKYAFAMINPRGSGGRSYSLVEPGLKKTFHFETYTRYFKRTQEFRIHATKDHVFDIQEKRLRKATIHDANFRIRNMEGGWVFCREDVTIDERCMDAAVLAVEKLGLDFGAVDIGWHAPTKRYCIFEVNTAPGLEGKSLTKYADMLEELIDET